MAERLRLGCCVESVPAQALEPTFDYLEVALDLIENPPSTAVPAPQVVMGMYPRGTTLVKPEPDLWSARARAQAVVGMVAAAGATDITFGAGAARSIPAQMSREAGYAVLGEIFALVAAAADERGVKVHLEIINAKASNVFNTVGEVVSFLDDHGLGSIGVVYDLRQSASQSPDPVAEAREHADRITHVHLPDSGWESETDAVLGILAENGYRGRISVEPQELALTDSAIECGQRARRAFKI